MTAAMTSQNLTLGEIEDLFGLTITDSPEFFSDVQDRDMTVGGRIDWLVIKAKIWLVVIEAKQSAIPIRKGIPQILVYLLQPPPAKTPRFVLVTNGDNFVFMKLLWQRSPCYSLSDQFSLLKQENELYSVLQILKKLRQMP